MHVPHFLVSTLPRALADTLQSVAVVAATQNAEVDKLVHRDIQPSQPYTHHMSLSENRVYSQWHSHLIGIMISKTIGFRGTQHFQTHPYIPNPSKSKIHPDPSSHNTRHHNTIQASHCWSASSKFTCGWSQWSFKLQLQLQRPTKIAK